MTAAAAAAYRRRHPERVRAARRVYEAARREQINARQRRYRAAHPEQFRKYDAQKVVTPEQRRAYLAAYRARNTEALAVYRAGNRGRKRAYDAQRRLDPGVRAKKKLLNASRRALKQATALPFTFEQLAAKLAYWNGCCWVCGDVATTWDHVKPLAWGGAHMLCNMRPACAPCNDAKGARWPLPSRAVLLGFAG